jgi:predicted component of type VI protein secretion system
MATNPDRTDSDPGEDHYERLVDELQELSDEERLMGEHFDEARHEQVVDDLRELRNEMRLHEDPTTSREAFEQEVAELGLSDDAGEVGDST